MSNLDVAVSSFWQLARHWKSGEKAKLELECEDGNLHLQLSAKLGHPDHPHFPTPPCPPPPVSCKRKSPSQLRRKERRQQEGLHRAEKDATDKEDASVQSEKENTVADSLSKDSRSETPATEEMKKTAENSSVRLATLNCDKCVHKANCQVSLLKHVLKEHKKHVAHERFKCNICSENLETKNNLTNHMIVEHNHPGEVLVCQQCEFMTSRKTCLNMHVSKKHKEIEQLDGTSSDTEDVYAESYWEHDHLGTIYQRYLDAIENIESSQLSLAEKQMEIERAKDIRMKAFLDQGMTKRHIERIPPWNNQ